MKNIDFFVVQMPLYWFWNLSECKIDEKKLDASSWKKNCKLEKKKKFQNATNFLDLAFKNQKKVLETQNKFFLRNLKKKYNFFYPKKIRFSLIKVKVMKGFHYKCTWMLHQYAQSSY